MKEKVTTTPILYDLAVIGGGPAGMMAAGRAAERGLKVILLEKNPSLGKKLLITGGGRCNVTNAEFDDRVLLAKFKDNAKFLFSAFAEYSVTEALEFFNSRGMETKVEPGKRVFPVSDSAQSVHAVLLFYMKEGKVTIQTNASVNGFVKNDAGLIEAVTLKNGDKIFAKSFVIATGGTSHPETGSTGEGFSWLAGLGHTIRKPEAALVPVEVSDTWVKKLSGISYPTAKITLFQNNVKQSVNKGKILFTHFGLSGPGILNLSSEIGELMKYGDVVISLDILPQYDYATLNKALQDLFAKEHNKKFKNSIDTLVPTAFVDVIIERSGIDPDIKCNSVTREDRLKLVQLLKDIHIHPTGLLGLDKAIITSGGVALDEVDFKTMRSRIVPNLHLVGDVLDIDRPSGGYSLQLCWTTGWVAGSHASA